MIYLDTSAIIKLYVKEKYSKALSTWIRENNEPVPLTGFHDLEFNNALRLKQFRGEVDEQAVRSIISRFDSHQNRGVFYRPQTNWPDVFNHAVRLSNRHTSQIGARSLDVLHVASALAVDADSFLTFDEKQSNLAHLAGIRLITI